MIFENLNNRSLIIFTLVEDVNNGIRTDSIAQTWSVTSNWYRNLVEKDFKNSVEKFENLGKFLSKEIVASSKITYELTDSMEFEASISKSERKIKIGIGTIFSLDDLFYRLNCNKDFFSKNGNNLRLWDGTQCLWPIGPYSPKIRFLDYEIVKVPHPDYNLVINKNKKTIPIAALLHINFCGIPFCDGERIILAQNMSSVALMWIFFHEEGHYWNGHTHLESVILKNHQFQNRQNEVFKVLEWQADRNATYAVVDILLPNIDISLFELPSYLDNENYVISNIRFILTTICTNILLFQKSNIKNGTSKRYPNTKTRLLSVILGCAARSMDYCLEKLNLTQFEFIETFYLPALELTFYDLYTVESVITGEVKFENNFQKVYYETSYEKDLNFISSVDFDFIYQLFLKKVLDETSYKVLEKKLGKINEEKYSEWSSEFDSILHLHNSEVYPFLKEYRAKTSNGISPDPIDWETKESNDNIHLKKKIDNSNTWDKLKAIFKK